MSSTEENSQLAPCYIIPNNFSYRISFCTGGKNSSVYTRSFSYLHSKNPIVLSELFKSVTPERAGFFVCT